VDSIGSELSNPPVLLILLETVKPLVNNEAKLESENTSKLLDIRGVPERPLERENDLVVLKNLVVINRCESLWLFVVRNFTDSSKTSLADNVAERDILRVTEKLPDKRKTLLTEKITERDIVDDLLNQEPV
jgi:hypothetical protein